MDFYQKYVKLCKDNDLTPTTAALNAGISRGTVNRWKKGYNPTDINLQKVADYFGVTVDYFKKEELPDKAEQSDDELDRELIEGYSRLDEEGKKIVSDLIRTLLSHR